MQERFLSNDDKAGGAAKVPQSAFILGAGLGTRLRPLTDDIPKPMVEVLGAPMISLALDKLASIGVQNCTVNTHYKADVLEAHLAAYKGAPNIVISHEDTLLDTGGGIKAALDSFTDDFFVLSGDSVWEDTAEHNALLDLANAWDPEKMDILMLLQPVGRMSLTRGVGDYDLSPDGQAVRSMDKSGAYMFTSLRINSPRIFEGSPDGAFSYLELMDKAQEKGRLYGLVHQGEWHHISTPDDVRSVNGTA